MHECQACGQYCDCDGEDLDQPQPNDCVHLTAAGNCEAEEDDHDDD